MGVCFLRNFEFSFRYAKFELPIRYSSESVKKSVGNMDQKLGRFVSIQ